jgi:RNA polymerase sigma-70 factor (ECF subfamily)
MRNGRRREALSLVMDWYGERIYRFCRSMIRDPQLAADVHQIVFVSAYESMASNTEVASFEGWLLGIARHRCLDALKARRRWFKRFQFGEVVRHDEDPAPVADQRLEGGQRNLALVECLARLATKVREAVVLRYQESLTFEEMARMSGEQAPTLQARVARALPGLRRCLEQKGWAAS